MKMSIITKIILSVVGIILILGIVATGVVFSQTQKEFVRLKKDCLEKVSIEKSYELSNDFENSQILLETIVQQDEIRDVLGEFKKDKDFEEAKGTALGILEKYNIGGKYLALYVMDGEGKVLVSTDESFIDKNYGFREYFKKSMDGQSYIDVARGVTSKKLGYYFSQPIIAEDEVLGVMVAKLDPSVVHESLLINEEENSEDSFEYILTDEYGVVLHASEEGKIMKSLGELSENYVQAIANKRRYDGVDITRLDYGEIQEELGNIYDFRIFELKDEYDDKEELLVVKKLDDLQFYFITELEIDSVFEESSRLSMVIAGLVLAAAIGAAIVIWIVVRGILTPIRELSKVAEEISEGNLEIRSDISSKDELGDLSLIFNEMTDQLVKEREQIEEKIKERTEELEKTNKFMVGRELKMIELKKRIKELEKQLSKE